MAIDLRRDQLLRREARGEFMDVLGQLAAADGQKADAGHLAPDFGGAAFEAFGIEEHDLHPGIADHVELVRQRRERMDRHIERGEQLQRMGDVEALGNVRRDQRDAVAGFHAHGLQRLHEAAGFVAHVVHRKRRSVELLEQGAAATGVECIGQHIGIEKGPMDRIGRAGGGHCSGLPARVRN